MGFKLFFHNAKDAEYAKWEIYKETPYFPLRVLCVLRVKKFC